MSAHRQIITRRREALVRRSEDYRFQIKRHFEQMRPRIDYIATVLRFVNSLRSKIGVIGGIAALLIVRPPSTIASWVKRGWVVWQLVRRSRYR
jgi:YqjK-like protein